jgi:hypothetical protein
MDTLCASYAGARCSFENPSTRLRTLREPQDERDWWSFGPPRRIRMSGGGVSLGMSGERLAGGGAGDVEAGEGGRAAFAADLDGFELVEVLDE